LTGHDVVAAAVARQYVLKDKKTRKEMHQMHAQKIREANPAGHRVGADEPEAQYEPAGHASAAGVKDVARLPLQK
jgi:hypothetical protein